MPESVGSQLNFKKTSRSLLMGLVGGGVVVVPSNLVTRMAELPLDEVPDYSTENPEAWWWD